MVIDAVIALLLLLGLAGIIYGPWQWVCTDVARQVIFEHRDAIYDMARAGKLDFDSSEYKEIRSSMEKTIRYGHQLTIPRLIYLYIVWRPKGQPAPVGLFTAIEKIENTETQEEIKFHIHKMFQVVTVSLLAKSPFWLLFFLPFVIVMKALSKLPILTEGGAQRIGKKIQEEAESADDLPIAA